jgi:antitoxin (DNA-binding transcriptional repressor) of toxin-antitoxin stability system
MAWQALELGRHLRGERVMIANMEPRVLHVSEADAVRDLAGILRHVQAGAEIIIERDALPLAVIRSAAPGRRTISGCIALAEAHEKDTGQAPVLDPDFAEDVEAIIRSRKPRNPPTWD